MGFGLRRAAAVMRGPTLLLVLALALATAQAAKDAPSLLEASASVGLPDAANLGYVPTSVPFDNPNTLSEPVPTIPSAPDCTVRPQTIVEIKRMRRSAARIAQMIQTEVAIMEKRKTYVEQMTAYLNDRIRELNKVKGELEQENRWIEVSNQRIAELAQKEKMIKMQDILSCLQADQQRLSGENQAKAKMISDITSQTTALQSSIAAIKKSIEDLNTGKKGDAGAAPK